MTIGFGILSLLDFAITFFWWAVILAAVFSMLASFQVIDTRNRIVWQIGDALYRVTEPLLRPIRRVLPNFGNLDFSPLVVLLLLTYVARPLLYTLYSGLSTGEWRLL